MTRSVLIGKDRRVTLEELASVALQDGVLEIHLTEDITDMSSFDEVFLSEALSRIQLKDSQVESDDESLLSVPNTRAVLILFANFLAQSRIMSSATCLNMAAAASIAFIVNSQAGRKLQLSCIPQSFISRLMEFMPEEIQKHVLQQDPMVAYLPLVLNRIIPLAMVSLATIQTAHLTKTSVVDALAALSVERNAVDPAVFDDALYDMNRPHRGMMTSASVLRVCIQGSKFATKHPLIDVVPSQESIKAAIESIPAYHGPASDVVLTSIKVLELECNCFESLDLSDKKSKPKFIELDPLVIDLACQSITNAVVVLLEGCKSRMGLSSSAVTNSASTTNTTTGNLLEMVKGLCKNVSDLYTALEQEATENCKFIQMQVANAVEEAKKKAEEKAVRAAKMNQESNGNNQNDEDEFKGMTEAQKAKILKKREEKEAKAAKKRAAKSKGTGDADVSIFGAGSMAVVNVIVGSSFDKEGIVLSPDVIFKMEDVIGKLLSGGVQRKPKIAKGTRDYLPEQMMIRDQAFQIIRRVFKSHGAVEIDTPVFELKDTLTGKYGEDSKLIYDLADQGGELLALRYDLTVPFARFLALNAVGNIKRFHIGKVYRRDQPQLSKGRYREFYQCDFDIAGTYGRMVPDSECLCVACEILSSLPIGNFGIKLNHRRLLDAILDLSGVPSEKFRTICSAVDKLDKEPWSEVKREMVEDKGLSPEVADKIGVFVVQKGKPWDMYNALTANAVFGQHKSALDALEDLRILFEYLEAMGKLEYISFDLSLARGLDYYTGVIYEAVCMNGNTQVGSIGGGGRYDNLVSMFQEAGKITPCVGVSVGIERVFTLMEERLRQEQGGSIKQPNVKVLVAQAGENLMLEKMKVTKLLWDANISAEFNQQDNPKLKYEIADALDRNIPFMVVIGEDEAREKKCKIKDLNARTEETVDQSELASALRAKGVIPVGCEFAAELMASETK
eukprot:CAMPEP_0176501598 /NCGR_PEP_ID=MMETSP0200_2-20121128/14246_1 /TAXON_ID=947934 /ORGANISM="Chaetoceros sp., Strain GSL56" /LENGTH=958 /DNA_ID=CAMNT_0017900495 /DNA_START=69 /DNA_END=2945 /DNA_ORIENTATION=-